MTSPKAPPMTEQTRDPEPPMTERDVAAERIGTSFQSRVNSWLIACFGAEIASDRVERNHRFIEEALELVQSTGCTKSEAHQLVDYVYGRPTGEPHQEVGGVMNTLAALCLAHAIDLDEAAETELARVWTKVEKIRAKQAAKPKHSPLPERAAAIRPEPSAEPGPTTTIPYTNWRGEFGMRQIAPIRLYWGSNEWHPEAQWLIEARDVVKGEVRTFALSGIRRPDPEPSADAVKLVDAYGALRASRWEDDAPARIALLDYIAGLKAEIERLNGELDIACREWARAEADLAAKDAEVERLRWELDTAQGAGRRLDEAGKLLEAELARFKAAQPKWLSLETAPKDGTLVLLSCDGMTGLGWWADERFGPSAPGEWRSYSFEGDDTWQPCVPMAWMPAPEPLPWGVPPLAAQPAPAPARQDSAGRVVCPECDGAGQWDEGPINKGGPAPVDPEYRQVVCPECEGTGKVAVAERDLWKEACRRAGVCMSCAIRTPEPFGCTDCLNTGWNCGEPVECQKARDEAFELAASDVEGCARNGRSLPSEMAACIRARKGSPTPARQDSEAVAMREALEDIRSILGPKPGFVGQQILAITNKALFAAPAPERRDVWQPIETAPRDRLIEVYAPEYECLNATISLCQWHEDAGFCICELRTPTHWREHNPPALRTTTEPAEGERT